jgi:hypothetical protein
MSPKERALRVKQLAHWYTKIGFKPVGTISASLARFLYKILDIPEDSHYLMVMTP